MESVYLKTDCKMNYRAVIYQEKRMSVSRLWDLNNR